MNKTTPAERRKAQDVIQRMAAEIGYDHLTIRWRRTTPNDWWVTAHKNIDNETRKVRGDTLDDAFLKLDSIVNDNPPF